MKRVYLIRHGLPEFPGGQRQCIGSTDLPLSAEGLAQARDMARTLPQVTAVFSSPLIRAVQTAGAIGSDFTILDSLRELDYGQWEGLTFPEIRQNYPELYAARADDLSLQPPGAESIAEGLARFSAAMAEAARRSPGDLAVVAHGGIIALFLESVTGSWYKPRYCEVISLVWDDFGFIQQEEAP
ncbi:MAG: histidine phosphatase family protein [Eubacteriales bacterium]|nr:histidine phosphatase family protein [Eubacteriales bacterium]